MKYIASVLLLLCSLGAMAEAKIEFAKQSHDFGTIRSKDGKVSCTYEFTNTGDEPLVIISVSNGGCGCTTPDYPKEPIQPGAKGTVTIHFNPAGRQGEFDRSVKVKTNASGARKTLKFSGAIVP